MNTEFNTSTRCGRLVPRKKVILNISGFTTSKTVPWSILNKLFPKSNHKSHKSMRNITSPPENRKSSHQSTNNVAKQAPQKKTVSKKSQTAQSGIPRSYRIFLIQKTTTKRYEKNLNYRLNEKNHQTIYYYFNFLLIFFSYAIRSFFYFVFSA